MKIISAFALTLCAVLFLGSAASASVKVNSEALAEVQKVALVGYSFYRVVEMEPASPFKLKRQFVELRPEDPEYLMMQEADSLVVAQLQKVKAFELHSQKEVFSNSEYQALSRDPAKRINLSWYFPKEFRDLKRSKSNATALAKALDVDAVLWIQFTHKESESSTTTLGAFGKSKKYIRLMGEITLFDRAGNEIVSGSLKSAKILKSSRRAFGAVGGEASGIEIETAKNTTTADDLWFPLLESYLNELNAELVSVLPQ